MKKTRIGIIGGTGFSSPIEEGTKIRVGTPYGPSPTIMIGNFGGKEIAYLPRHGEKHTLPPHMINYRASIWALHSLGVERVLATNSVGAVNAKYKPGDLIIPVDFIDFTRSRNHTFYDEAPVTHIDVSTSYCPELREILSKAADNKVNRVWHNAIYLCTEGPRYESPAEIRMFRKLGGDVVGMTGVSELVLARELEMCYAALCFVTNMAAGLQERLSAELIAEGGRNQGNILQEILREVVEYVPWKRSCLCPRTLEGTRV